jgi:hypothetical protein
MMNAGLLFLIVIAGETLMFIIVGDNVTPEIDKIYIEIAYSLCN